MKFDILLTGISWLILEANTNMRSANFKMKLFSGLIKTIISEIGILLQVSIITQDQNIEFQQNDQN